MKILATGSAQNLIARGYFQLKQLSLNKLKGLILWDLKY